MSSIAEEFERELERATKKFPDCVKLPDGTGLVEARKTWRTIAQNWCDRAHREGILTHADVFEEEVAEALAESDPVLLRKELVQVGAMVLKWIRDIDSRPGAKISAAAETNGHSQADIEDQKTRTGDAPGSKPASPSRNWPSRGEWLNRPEGQSATPAAAGSIEAEILGRLDSKVKMIFERAMYRLASQPLECPRWCGWEYPGHQNDPKPGRHDRFILFMEGSIRRARCMRDVHDFIPPPVRPPAC